MLRQSSNNACSAGYRGFGTLEDLCVEKRTSPWAVGTATLVNGGLIALLLLNGIRPHAFVHPYGRSLDSIETQDQAIYAPLLTQGAMSGGGGGGAHDLIAPREGNPPKFERAPLIPPVIPSITKPLLAIENAIAAPPEVKLPENPALMTVGVQRSVNVTLDSNGPGKRAGIGTGIYGGDGPGDGPGYGPGKDGGIGGDVYSPGGDVSAPTLVVAPEAEFSDEARRNKYEGICVVGLIVDAQGNPRNLQVLRHLGMGLDEKALDAVARYKFKPAKKNGRPVAVRIQVYVNFRMF
ncbi:energy transducer TonB [Acidicapsa dinghuensis]|uniref:Energy transducer TonB n=1 Tax=Acidicapsa dinghuensis TaxID=2218256 RepID=A0ABW1E8W9_9BACT|nr:energy transducer TonB [Acidicapsa dinghuensis]